MKLDDRLWVRVSREMKREMEEVAKRLGYKSVSEMIRRIWSFPPAWREVEEELEKIRGERNKG